MMIQAIREKPVVSLTFYGGINEIGGNIIPLEYGNWRLLLDFGFPTRGTNFSMRKNLLKSVF